MKAKDVDGKTKCFRALFCCSLCWRCRKQKVMYENMKEKVKYFFEKRKLASDLAGKVKIDNHLT